MLFKRVVRKFFDVIFHSSLYGKIRPIIFGKREKGVARRAKNRVVVMGDSHVRFFSGRNTIRTIPFHIDANGTIGYVHSKDRRFCIIHYGPALAYNLINRYTKNRTREKYEYLLMQGIIGGVRESYVFLEK